ncbi:MAG: glutamate formimidoyltransferase, partial [Erysipelotrichales bacterium]|nr:glutamate formimidoyltransferase [Erysipelotrichales bacterium]
KIVECVPNYSVGNNPEVIDKITAPFKNTPNVSLVNVESDDSYNRSVVTVIGEPEAVCNAVVESVKIATALIDMRVHHGEHKRMGATDVVPFIPIQNMSVEEAIEISEKCAKLINETTNIPVFLYSHSAKREHCRNLPDIRKGEFEGMEEKLKDPMWKPDFGDSVHPTAGVTAVGCRPLLVAFNIDLNTEDKDIALYIARAIRFSGGGYRYIQAGPAHLEDKHIYQVTMNVTDYTKTSVYRAFEAVKMEAKRFNVDVIGSEFVGLVSLDCIKDIAAYYLHLPNSSAVDLSLSETVKVVNEYLLLHGFNDEKVIEYYV